MVCFLFQCTTAGNNSDTWTKASSSWSLLLLRQPRPLCMIFSLLPSPLADPAWGPFRGHSAPFWLQTMLAIPLPFVTTLIQVQVCLPIQILLTVLLLPVRFHRLHPHHSHDRKNYNELYLYVMYLMQKHIDMNRYWNPSFHRRRKCHPTYFEFDARICWFF